MEQVSMVAMVQDEARRREDKKVVLLLKKSPEAFVITKRKGMYVRR